MQVFVHFKLFSKMVIIKLLFLQIIHFLRYFNAFTVAYITQTFENHLGSKFKGGPEQENDINRIINECIYNFKVLKPFLCVSG